MSKATIKKILQSMPKEEIIDMVLEMYDARKEAKEYLEFYANPDEDGKLEEYKKIITEEFYPTKGRLTDNTLASHHVMTVWQSILIVSIMTLKP